VTVATLPAGVDTVWIGQALYRVPVLQPKVAVVNGHVWVVWDQCKEALKQYNGICVDTDVRASHSTTGDSGTWSAPVTIGDGSATNQFFPTISVDPVKGYVYIGFYTMIRDPTWNHRYDVAVYRAGFGTPTTYSFAAYATSTPNEPEDEFYYGGDFIGDYFQLTAYGGLVFVHFNANYVQKWIEYSGGAISSPGAFQQDNYLKKLVFT